MTLKKYITIIAIILVIMFAISAIYFTMLRRIINEKKKSVIKISQTQTVQKVNWQNLIPEIRKSIEPVFLDTNIETSEDISIFQKADITGDGINEALVNIGAKGAYTDYLTLMRIEKGKPIAANLKKQDGQISPLIFLTGSSAINGERVRMLPKKNLIYAGHWSKTLAGNPFGNLSNCAVDAYQWNPETLTFEFNLITSNEIRPEFCKTADE